MALRPLSRVARGVPAGVVTRARRLSGALRTLSLRRARRIVVPSRYLAEIARGWGLDAARIEVLVNPAPPPADVEPAPLEPGTFVFVGRSTHQKALPVLLEAIAARRRCAGSSSSATAPSARALEALVAAAGLDRTAFGSPGALPRDRGARASRGRTRPPSSSSAWENLPHAAVEALVGRDACRLDGGRRRARGGARRRERPARAAERSCGTRRCACGRSWTTTRCGRALQRRRSRRSLRSDAT